MARVQEMRVLLREPRVLVRGRERLERLDDFAGAVRAGLEAPRKALPCRFFYDEEGSRLFEAICELEEYYPTRAEAEILREHATEIAAAAGGECDLVELGSGSAVKTRILIEALLERWGRLCYAPLDISRSALEGCARTLARDYPGLTISALACEYAEGLAVLAAGSERRRLVLWLGSNVGNFGRAEGADFLARVRGRLGREDRLLIGIDLRKERGVLERAYDDAAGVTARFNKNLLVRINRELGGEFDLDAFRHRARYLEAEGCVEMHLVSLRAQRVRVASIGLEVHFARGEEVHTESSYKYSLREIDELAARAGFDVAQRWLDAGERFSLNLLAPLP